MAHCKAAAPRHRLEAVDQIGGERVSGEFRDKVGGPALHRMRSEGRMAGGNHAIDQLWPGEAARHQRRVLRLRDNNRRARAFGLQHACDALQGAAGAEARHPVIQAEICEVRQNLACRRAGMDVGIGLGLELATEEPAMCLGKLHRLGEHAAALLRGRSQHHLRAEKTHQFAPFDAEVLRHDDDEGIAFLRADHGEPDAGVARGSLDDRLTGAERAGALGRLDHA